MRTFLSAVFLCGALGCKGEGSIGESCSQSGAADECVAGAVCGKPSDGTTSLQCLKACTLQTDCAAGEDCNGVEGSTAKGCRPKTNSDGGAKK